MLLEYAAYGKTLPNICDSIELVFGYQLPAFSYYLMYFLYVIQL